MRKLIAATNLTLDGFCDHTAGIADDEIHQHYNELFKSGDTVLFGRITYQLMESSWPSIVKNPTGNKPIDEFAHLIENIEKIVFSRTLKTVEWKNARLAREGIKEEVLKLKAQPGKDIFAASRTIITTLMHLGLIDEFQFCFQPIILGRGLPFFQNARDRHDLKLLRTKTFGNGSVILYLEKAVTES